jgi:hypothetical protein
LAFFVDCWLVEDVSPPIPDPAEWLIEPYSMSATAPYGISMTAKTAYDAWGWSVEYYFECVSDGDYNSPDWQSDTIYEVTGLDLGTELCFKVKAREVRPYAPDEGMETGYSRVECAIAGPDEPNLDTTPPAPAPFLLTVEPNAPSPNSITMTASATYDRSGVEYFFQNITILGHESGWQDEPNWADLDLTPETEYCYRVRARDKSINQNETGWSDTECAITLEEPDTEPPIPDPMLWDYSLDVNGLDGRPREIFMGPDPIWGYGATMRADPNTIDMPVDSEYDVEFYFECVTRPGLPPAGLDSGWMFFPAPPYVYRVQTGVHGQSLWFRVRARDRSPNRNETGWSQAWPIN